MDHNPLLKSQLAQRKFAFTPFLLHIWSRNSVVSPPSGVQSLPEYHSYMFRVGWMLPALKRTAREFKLPWREAGPPNHHDDKVDSDLR